MHGLWVGHTIWTILQVMAHVRFSLVSSNLQFDDRLTQPVCHKEDKLAAWTLWEKWAHLLPALQPGPGGLHG